jgi:hypothetical protein
MTTPGQLANLRRWAVKARDTKREREDLEDRIADKKRDLDQITKNDLLNVLNEYGFSELTIEPEGNEPGFEFSIKQVIAASIPKNSDLWSEERRQKAFYLLPDDIVYNNVTVLFAKGEAKKAAKLYDSLVKKGLTVVIEQSVNHMTLKSWIKHQLEEGGQLPALDDIGAHIFNEVKIKEVKR